MSGRGIGPEAGSGYPPTWLATLLTVLLVGAMVALPLLLAGCSPPTTCQGGQVCAGPYLIEW